jgi:hypothetical protein
MSRQHWSVEREIAVGYFLYRLNRGTHISPKRQYTSIRVHGAMAYQTIIFSQIYSGHAANLIT